MKNFPDTQGGNSVAPGWRRWLAVCVLGMGTFAIVATELAPIGLLSMIAEDLEETEAIIGLTVTAYAWIGAACALLGSVSLGRLPRKALLVTLMMGLAISNALAMVSGSLESLLAARVVGAVSHGTFWAMIGTIAAQLVPQRSVGLATSIVFGGVSAASLVGVPLANFIGQTEGWRVAFSAVAALAVVTAALIAATVPAVKSSTPVGRRALASIVGRKELWGIYAATAFAVTAHFAAYTFIEPLVREARGVPEGMTAVLLFTFGAAGLLGNLLTGMFVDAHLKTVLLLAMLLMSTAMIGLGVHDRDGGMSLLVVLLVAWGASIAAVFVGFQTWVLRIAGDAALPASAIYVAIFNAAIGLGAVAGSWLMARTGILDLMLCAGGVGVLCVLIVIALPQTSVVTA